MTKETPPPTGAGEPAPHVSAAVLRSAHGRARSAGRSAQSPLGGRRSRRPTIRPCGRSARSRPIRCALWCSPRCAAGVTRPEPGLTARAAARERAARRDAIGVRVDGDARAEDAARHHSSRRRVGRVRPRHDGRDGARVRASGRAGVQAADAASSTTCSPTRASPTWPRPTSSKRSTCRRWWTKRSTVSRPSSPATDFEVEIDVPADLPPVHGDRTAMGLLLDNLIDNAIRYSGESRWIGVRARRTSRAVRVAIAITASAFRATRFGSGRAQVRPRPARRLRRQRPGSRDRQPDRQGPRRDAGDRTARWASAPRSA